MHKHELFILSIIVICAVAGVASMYYSPAQTQHVVPHIERTIARVPPAAPSYVHGPIERDPAQLPTVVVVTTGGTIAEKKSAAAGGAVPALTGKELISAVPQLAHIANIRVVDFSNIDSSQMTPALWYNLSKKVDDILRDPDVRGVVVTHGTDTLAEGAYFLDLTLASKKPVAFVGAMRDASDLSPDGPANIYNAVTQVISPNAQHLGVTVTMNQYINAARNVRKTQTTNVQTFDSGEKGYLGYIEMGNVILYNVPPRIRKTHLPERMATVDLIETFAGDDGSYIRYAVDRSVEGIVVEGVGAGNVNEHVNAAIKYALSKNIPVVLTTRVYYGGVFPIYADIGGGATLKKEGVILAGDLSGPKARLLLMLALPQAISKEDLASYFK